MRTVIKATTIYAKTIQTLSVIAKGVRGAISDLYEIIFCRYKTTDSGYYMTSDGSYYNVKQKVKKQ